MVLLQRLTWLWSIGWSAHWASSFAFGAYGQGIIFCFAVGFDLLATALPTDLYSTFGLEAKFGFNKTTLGLYLADKLKGLDSSVC